MSPGDGPAGPVRSGASGVMDPVWKDEGFCVLHESVVRNSVTSESRRRFAAADAD